MPPDKKAACWARPTRQVDDIDQQFQRGLITDDERYEQVVDVWQTTTAGRHADADDGGRSTRLRRR